MFDWDQPFKPKPVLVHVTKFEFKVAVTITHALNLKCLRRCCGGIDHFHNDSQIKYSFVLMLISLSGLVTTSKF